MQSRIGVEISFYSIPQEPTEHISEKVGEFLQELGAKPRLEAAKIGLKVKHSSIYMHFSIFAITRDGCRLITVPSKNLE